MKNTYFLPSAFFEASDLIRSNCIGPRFGMSCSVKIYLNYCKNFLILHYVIWSYTLGFFLYHLSSLCKTV